MEAIFDAYEPACAWLNDKRPDMLLPPDDGEWPHRDRRGLIRYGAIFSVPAKRAVLWGVSNLDIYASMRGDTLEDFMKARDQQVTYSVVAQPA